MRHYTVSIKALALFLALISITKLFGQCPSAIIESAEKVFYKDVLNEYTVKSIVGGKFTVTTNNGELLLIDGKKYIKPTKTGEIRITIEVDEGNGTVAKFFDYFSCEALPNPKVFGISTKQGTIELQNKTSIEKFKAIEFLAALNTVPSVKIKPEILSFTITIIRKNNEIESFNVKGNENIQSVIKAKAGDKVMFTNLIAKIEGESENRVLENRLIEIVE